MYVRLLRRRSLARMRTPHNQLVVHLIVKLATVDSRNYCTCAGIIMSLGTCAASMRHPQVKDTGGNLIDSGFGGVSTAAYVRLAAVLIHFRGLTLSTTGSGES